MRISIGGSIGSGKSTVLRELEKAGYDVFYEPVDEWKHISKFYSDRKRWSFTFQIEVLNSFLKVKDKDAVEDAVVVCERSPWESYNIFSKNLVEQGDMTVDEFELFKKVYDNMAWKPDIFIYLRSTPETCLERIKERSRSCETEIDIEYLRSLHTLYEGLYSRDSICVDANRSAEDVYTDVKKILEDLTGNTHP